ncbi:nodulation protein NfeD [SAR202 cluster bacterium AC-409-J13_OGT_754m]|nr:nodulation protein NfeD [SAR202 cluster bacterium AC-409-J13_OGT_754m]
MKSHNVSKKRIFVSILFMSLMTLGIYGQVSAQERFAVVTVINGMINPITQNHIEKTVESAERDGAELVIIQLNTPGGMTSSTYKIVESLLNAKVPTVVYVSPRGAQAASAGTFITAAAHIAVMAPGTNIGAASPVGMAGEELKGTVKAKITNDATARMRGIALERNRNSAILESTILDSASFSSHEALDANIIDFIASDLDDLIIQLDGSSLSINGDDILIETSGLTIRTTDMGIVNQFLYLLADPNISFLLLSIGGLALVVEIMNPGLIFPGITGVIFLILAFVSLGNLPVNWAGAALILIAGALFIAEVYISGFGILGIGSVISFVLGGILLFSHFDGPSPTGQPLSVNLWIIVPLSAILTTIIGWVGLTITRPGKSYQSLDPPPTIGDEAIVASTLSPTGTVYLNNQVWTATTSGNTVIEIGSKVRVVGKKGIILAVVLIDQA